MRRTLATLLLALLTVATSVGSTAAAKPPSANPGSPAPSPSATPDPTPTPVPTPLATETPSIEPSPSVTPPPDAEPTPTATAAASPTEAPPETAPPSVDPSASAQTPTVADPTPTVDPSLEPSLEPGASDPADPTGRYIVMLADGADPTAVVGRHQKREGTKADRTFQRAFRGFAAKLDKRQREALLADPTVVAVVPDEKIELTAQTVPTGVSRIGGRLSSVADIDGQDTRVDADIAIVDTGIQRVADLNVAGGYNCSSSTRTAWQDPEGHGTHVAGTAAALDNNIGVVGVAPGARLWAVRILDSSGSGLLSWYVCGLDWILAQRDPDDPSQPLIEVVNMSVTKWGRDDLACGAQNNDVLHAAICRLVKGGITVVVAAANDSGSASKRVPASYNEVITVSALADTDGKSGSQGGNRCYSWGGYDSDDTFANFSNYGADVDIMAPGKCIWSTLRTGGYGYMSGTSMASPTAAGAAALYLASRPSATPADVREALQYLGNYNYQTSTDPDGNPDKLLDVGRLGARGSFAFRSTTPSGTITDGGGTVSVPILIDRSSTHFERVRFKVTSLPSGWSASWAPSSILGFSARSTTLNVTVPAGTNLGTYGIQVTGTSLGTTKTTQANVVVGPGATWHSVTATRRLDTRRDIGLSGPFPSRTVRTFQVSGGDIPSDAIAVTGNLTVTGATSDGFVSLGPSLTTSPSTSSLNVARSQTIANGVTVQLAAGRLSAVFVGASGARAHLLFDITGYYAAGSGGQTWYGFGPKRLLDTRTGNGLAGDFHNGVVRSVMVAGRSGLPSGVVAVTGNVTVTGATGSGYLAVGPTLSTPPPTSTLNFVAGRALANNITVRVSTSGRVSAVIVGAAGLRADVVLDITGYYLNGNGGARWYAMPVRRLIDTRTGKGLTGRFAAGTPRAFQVTGGSIPVDAKAVNANLVVTGVTGSGYVSAGPTLTSTPTTSTINVVSGQTLANGLILRVTSGGRAAAVFKAPSGTSTHLILDLVGYFR